MLSLLVYTGYEKWLLQKNNPKNIIPPPQKKANKQTNKKFKKIKKTKQKNIAWVCVFTVMLIISIFLF